MGLWDVLLGVWQNGGQVVVLGGAGYGLAQAQRVPGEVERHDELVRDLNEDLRRWVADRDRQLTADLKKITAYANNPDLEGPEVVPPVVELRGGGRVSEFSQRVEAATSGAAVAMVV